MDDSELQFGRFRLDLARCVLLHDGAPVRLGPRATDLLLVLVQRRGAVVSKAELFDLVWPGLVVEENNLQQHISTLRKLFGPQAIATVPGRGYLFTLSPDGDPSTGHDRGRDDAQARTMRVPAGAPLIGRNAELSELRERVLVHAVVTVVGPGGIGKTRLALAVAQTCNADFADGVYVADLSVLTDGGQAMAAVAQALGIVLPLEPAAVGRHAQTIAAALRGRELLLVLDNCEHVLDSVAALVDVLRQRALHARVLATSQEPLHVADEQVFRLAPLDVPSAIDPADDDARSEAATQSGAVQLFVARAQAVDRFFFLTPDVLPAVVDICRRVDGLPLAIELAAARLPLLGVYGLQQRLDERLGALGAQRGRGPPRQQTIRAALTWSHALLSRDEQIVWRRLGVFSGGFSLDLAHRVLVDADLTPESVLDYLGALIDKSLVMTETGHDPRHPRYRLLEPARVFALAQLEQADELDALRLRHAKALGELLHSYDDLVVHERRFDVVVARMAAELDNLRAAMRWLADLIAHPSATATVEPHVVRLLAITLAAYGDWLWSEVDSFGEGLRFCRLARGCLGDDVPVALAARLRLAHQLLARTRLRPAAEWAIDAPLALKGFREVGDRVGLYRALCALGGAPRAVVGDDESIALLHEAEQLEAPDWSPVLRRRRQAALEWCHDQAGRDEACREAGLRSVALAHQAGGVGEIAALGNLADTEFALGLVDDAIKSCRRAIVVATELRRPEEAFNAFQHMVPALLERGNLAEAEAAIRQGRDLLVRCLGSANGMLMPLALLALKRGDGRLALQLVGCADRARNDEGLDLHSPERRIREALLAGMRSILSEAQISTFVASGALWDADRGFAVGGLG
ncbi:ATP-binding protein [Roseateles sp. P5_E7]